MTWLHNWFTGVTLCTSLCFRFFAYKLKIARLHGGNIYVLMCENGKIRPVETVQGMGEGEQRSMLEVLNLTMIYCKNFCKCHSALQYNKYDTKKRK
jgi:hypothetical protein